ncbi:MAG TPA: flagellar export chaperone FlgN [Tepidisphaeraceae bacterium]|jgi:flagellar biosynthesis/type III secretory pathway chaperone
MARLDEQQWDVEMNSTDSILSALTEQVACYRKLAKLADAQHQCVQQGQTEQLLNILKKRQEVLDRITALEQILGPVRKNWTGYRDTLDAQGKAMAEKLMAEVRSLLEEIMSADRNDTIVLQQRKIAVTRQIAATGKGQQVNRRYAASAYGGMRRSSVDIRSS